MKLYFKSSLAGCLTATAILCSAGIADASILVNQNSSAPSLDNVYKYRELNSGETAGNLSFYKRTGGSWRIAGQQFNTSGETDSVSINAVTFQLQNFTTDVLGKNFSLSIYEAASVTMNPANATRIYHDSGTIPLDLTAGEYITFTFDAAQELAAGRFYTVVFEFLDTTGSNGSLAFTTVGSSSNTPLNRIWASTNTNEWGYASASGGFVTYIHTAAIPEPTSTALLLGALVTGVGYRFARRKVS